ncbi:MAG TPA: DNA-binding transcriptional regulator [Fimbriimonas sp.]|nr:DNA-binding transcriptional regulator [Fimbriimonas sp.]
MNRKEQKEDTPTNVVKEASPAYASETLATVHRLASGLYEAGVFSKATMRKYDQSCLTEVLPMAPEDIRDLRETSGVSQAVFAKILNVTTNAVGQWERGEKRPTGSALKLLALVRSKGLAAIL